MGAKTYFVAKNRGVVKNQRGLEINNLDVYNKIKPYIDTNRLLSAAQIVGNYYKDQYPKMELSDWINLVRKIN